MLVAAVPSPHTFTLVANTAATVELNANYGRIEVLNVDGAAEIYFTNDASAPTVGGDGCHVLPAAIGSLEVDDRTVTSTTFVKLISAGTPKVSVRGL